MKKLISEIIIFLSFFFLGWAALYQVNWVEVFHVEKRTDSIEKQLGELLWDFVQETSDENHNPYVKNTIDSLVAHICEENNIDKETLQVHVFNSSQINAFALPDRHLVIYSELILEAETQEELSGVICHEIAHIELNHVMQKLVREIGLSVLVSATTGSGNTKEIARILTSSAFSRELEQEADLQALQYLNNARISPDGLANFLYRVPDSKYNISWISTHPDPKDRAMTIIEEAKMKNSSYEKIITDETWDRLKKALRNE